MLILSNLSFLVGKQKVIGLPTFQSAKAPGHIESKGDDGQQHDQQPVPKKPDPGAPKDELALVDEGMFGNPPLLSGIGPWKK